MREYDRVMDMDLQKFDGWLPCGPLLTWADLVAAFAKVEG